MGRDGYMPTNGCQAQGDARKQAVLPARVADCLFMGLGLTWSASEVVTFVISTVLESPFLGIPVLYVLYLPMLLASGILFVIAPPFLRPFAKERFLRPLVVCGAAGLTVMATFANNAFAQIVGLTLFVLCDIALSYQWLAIFSRMSPRFLGYALVGTLTASTAGVLLWSLPQTVLPLVAAVLLFGSYACCSVCSDDASELAPDRILCRTGRVGHWGAPAIGVAILSASFAFLQLLSYRAGAIEKISGELCAHLISLAMMAVLTFGLRDTEHIVAAKLITTLMLFSFVAYTVLGGLSDVSVALARGMEGLLEALLYWVLVDIASLGGARPARLLGANYVVLGSSQLIGCVLALLEGDGNAAYSYIGLFLVALLIVDAVWLLNDKTITRMLWSGDTEKMNSGGAPGVCATSDFEARIAMVADECTLTARETEVLSLFARSRSSSFIAESLGLSSNTVRSHIAHIYAKCNVHSRQELITMVDKAERQP